MHSIRFKITAISIVVTLAAILCVFAASLSIIRAESNRRSVEMMNLIAQDTQKSLEKNTEGIEQAVETVANLASDTLDSVVLVQDGVSGGNKASSSARTPEQVAHLDAYLTRYCQAIRNGFATVASHTRGTITYYYCINPDVSIAEHGFFYSRVGKTGFAEREPLDARELDPNDIEHTTWYYTPIQRGRPSWVGPYKAHFLGEMLICSYVVPIYKTETLIGVLGMDIAVDTFVSQVKSISVYENGFACLLDESGHIIYHPDLPFGSTLNIPLDEDTFKQSNNGNELIRYTFDGEERQLSFTTLSNGMKLAIVAPVSEVNASSMQLVRVILPVSLVAIIVSALLTMMAMRFIIRPLLRLTDASQHLADADYNVELNYQSRDEVGMLTSAFKNMRTELETYIDDLDRRVHTDDLTGLPNQRSFFVIAMAAKNRLLEEGKSPVLLYFNLNGLKHFNRQYGFEEGDKLICAFADTLARHFGKDNTSRFGQDYFAVVSDGDRLEERLSELFKDCQSMNGGQSLPVSVGIYPCGLKEVGVSIACDRAKFACDKRRGSYVSGFCYFDDEMLSQVERIRYVINHLDQALEEKWIQVYYQPIVRAVNGKVCDEEALSRWIDPEEGFLSPADFIPTLEDAGLIYKVDLYVLDTVLEKIKQQVELGFAPVSHSINLSRSDFESCDIVEEICKRVDAAGIKRDRITIEITESIIGSDFEFMKEQVERFRSLGFPVWMDDFGSGYSSLDFLQSIKFDLLKFDMSFLRKLDDGDNGKIILTELMKMATELGVDTICEGVETEHQVHFLREIGCSKLQGFYFCKPIPLSEILHRYQMGNQIGYENPEESAYFEAIGRVDLYDLAAVANEDEGSLQSLFETLPAALLEIDGDAVAFTRTNQSFRDFMLRCYGLDLSERADDANTVHFTGEFTFMERARDCHEDGDRTYFDEVMPDGSSVHFLVRRIKTNPVTNVVALAIAVLSMSNPNV